MNDSTRGLPEYNDFDYLFEKDPEADLYAYGPDYAAFRREFEGKMTDEELDVYLDGLSRQIEEERQARRGGPTRSLKDIFRQVERDARDGKPEDDLPLIADDCPF